MTRRTKLLVLPAMLVLATPACNGDDGGTGTSESTGGDTGTNGSTGTTSADSSAGSTTDASTSTTNGSGTTTTDTATGGNTTGGGTIEAFRVTELYVREPHFFAEVVVQCFDVTDLDNGALKGVNPSFNEAMTTDMDDAAGSGNPDGNLDLSFVMLFDPLDQSGGGTYDFERADCKVPASNTVCMPRDMATVSTFDYASMMGATCLEPDPAHLNPMYSPKPVTVAGNCFASSSTALVLELGDISLPMTDAEVAAVYDADPADNFTTGLIKGFVSEADAQNATLPQSIQDATGATVLADLLPGSPANCAGHDDRDDNNGTSGWWFYVDFKAQRVPWLP